MAGYISPNTTTLGHIQSLFQVKTLRSILGVNNLPPNTPPSHTITGNTTIRIPFPCHCRNGTGISNRVPKYTVVKDDGLFHIASQVFSGLVDYPQIVAANGIKDPNLIITGQKLWIPLPCSCDDVEDQEVVHYAHVVASGSSVSQIAAEFGMSSESLMKVNNISDPKSLIAGQVLDVPIKACSSTINNSSSDSSLLVANDTLQCQPSGLKAVNWPTCPAMKCPDSNLLLSNSTTSSCSRTTCAYAGYNKQTVLTTLAVENTCPAPGSSDDSKGSRSRGWSLAIVLLSLQMIMLQIFL
uniref:LysM domain-containing protein n=1 Tax=Chenopodium quinoa TaxID=63459 RepID=A0A803MCE6_CHEQI